MVHYIKPVLVEVYRTLTTRPSTRKQRTTRPGEIQSPR